MFFGVELSLPVVCILVVIGRIIDMALCSIRTVYTVRSKPLIAALFGFFEAFIWFIIVKAALDYVFSDPVYDTIFIALSYSIGFAVGTYLGGLLSSIIVKTKISVQVVLSSKNDELVKALREKGYGQTILSAHGSQNDKETYFINIETEEKKLKELKSIIDSFDKKAFVSINETKQVFGGYFGNNK